MDDIFNMLLQTIETSAFPLFYAKSEYRRSQCAALQHEQWLEEHLDEEQKAHLQKIREADLCIDTLEREAMIRTAIAAGIRFALPGAPTV